MIIKQSISRHFIVSAFTWTVTILFGIGWWYFNFDEDYLLMVGLFHLLFTIPAVYLHIEYTIVNWGEEIEINNNGIIIRKEGQEYKYGVGKISEIVIYKSANLDKWGIPFFAIEYYYYARIVIKNDEQIIISCLMVRDLEKVMSIMSEVAIEKKRRLIASPWMDRIFSKN